MSTSVSWAKFDTDAAPVHVSVSWAQFNTRPATIHASVSWVQFDTRARSASVYGGGRKRAYYDYDADRLAVLRRNDESLLMALAAIVVARRYQ